MWNQMKTWVHDTGHTFVGCKPSFKFCALYSSMLCCKHGSPQMPRGRHHPP